MLTLQRVSWDINFPDREFYEHIFYTSLATAVRRGDVYVYEIESFWDPEKKQPRQRRRYLGKKDPDTGEIRSPFRGIAESRGTLELKI